MVDIAQYEVDVNSAEMIVVTQTALTQRGEGDEAGPRTMGTINRVMERPTTSSLIQSTSRDQVATVNQQASRADPPIQGDEDGNTRDHLDGNDHSQLIRSEGRGRRVSRKVASRQEVNGAEIEKLQAKTRLFASSNECMQIEKEKLKNELEKLRQSMRQEIEMHELQLERLRASIRHDDQIFLMQKENLTLQRKKLQFQVRKQGLEADTEVRDRLPVEDADDITLF